MRRRRNRRRVSTVSGFEAQHPRSSDGKFAKTELPEQQLAASFGPGLNVPLVKTATDGLINLSCARCGMMTSAWTYESARRDFDLHSCESVVSNT